MMKADFLYGVWHDLGGIKEGIEKYGPKNRYKRGFEDTTKTQRKQIFHAINVAVHQHGEGLADIEYESPSSGGPQQLLRKPEVIHLQDVANLIDGLRWGVLTAFIVWVGLFALSIKFSWSLPALFKQGVALAATSFLVIVFILILGPEKVFNTLHIWIFPKDHQWFFYYQDSLMSTMMLAPRLFAWISVALFLIAIPCYFVLNAIFHYSQKFALARLDKEY